MAEISQDVASSLELTLVGFSPEVIKIKFLLKPSRHVGNLIRVRSKLRISPGIFFVFSGQTWVEGECHRTAGRGRA